MFSFIKWFGSIMENAKKKKGLWFTLLTTFSLLGIFISLYFVNFLVSDVAKKTFENQKNHYVLALKESISLENIYIESLAVMMAKNEDIAKTFFSEDNNASLKRQKKTEMITKKVNKVLGKELLSISYKKVDKAKSVVGIDVDKRGAIFTASVPMVDNNGTISSVVVNKRIEALLSHYKKEHKEFAFLLNERSIHKVDRVVKKSIYESYHDDFYIKNGVYDKNFIEVLKKISLPEKLEESGYIKDSHYFYVYQKVYDIDGEYVGLAFVAEEIKDDNSFVNLVKNLVNSVTMVALGLIVSMLLFLF